MYRNYHCNPVRAVSLTESAPRVPRRELAGSRTVQLAEQAGPLSFGGLGVTGGEPFLRTDRPELLGERAGHLPVLLLTNGTLFTRRLLDRIAPLVDQPVAVQTDPLAHAVDRLLDLADGRPAGDDGVLNVRRA